ncbi:MAG: hypothetical protein Q9176_000130 [Flavoplaca citrina]
MERDATPSAHDDELTNYFNLGEDIGIYTPVHSKIQHHIPGSIHPSDDEEPSNLTLASKPPLYTTIEADSVKWINSVSLPSKDLGQAKRKRSDSTDLASPEVPKRLRSQTAHGVGASDGTKAPALTEGSKLNRPPPQLVEKRPCVPVSETGIFDFPSDDQRDDHPSNQAPKGNKKKGKPRKDKELSTAPVALQQSGALNESEVTATFAAPPAPTRRKRVRASLNSPSKGKPQQQSNCNLRNRIVKAVATPQLPERQKRSRKRQGALHSSVSPHPADHSEVISDSSAHQNDVIQENEPSDRGDATDNEQHKDDLHLTEPSLKAKHGVPGTSEPAMVAGESGKNDNVFTVNGGLQNSGQQPQSDDKRAEGADHESDEQESEMEDARDSEMESNESALEVLGQENAWAKIKEARREIGVSTTKGDKVKNIPKLDTEQGKELISIIKTATQVYFSPDQDDSNVQSQQAFKEVDRYVKDLSEEACAGEERKVVQDLYAHAVPKLVQSLETVLRASSTHLKQRNDTSTLKEVIGLQNILIRLCDKAREWKVKPQSSSPIIQPTRRIRRHVIDMRNAFRKELEDRKHLQKMRTNRANLLPEMDEASWQREREAKKREDWAILQHIVDDCNWGSRTQWGRKPAEAREPNTRDAPAQPPPAQLAGRMHEAMEEWSKEERKALLHELVDRKEYWNLTGRAFTHGEIPNSAADMSVADEMFLEALNAPLLQNKLPEHIREGALYYKAAIEKDVEKHQLPKWVSSI